MPLAAGSRRNIVTPRCAWDGSTVAATRKTPASAACEMKTLLPLRLHPLLVRVARVFMAARSVPPSGSVRQADANISPLASGGSHRWHCSGVPNRRIELPTSELATDTAEATTQSTRASSSHTMPYVTTSMNEPPYDSGIIGARKPSGASFVMISLG